MMTACNNENGEDVNVEEDEEKNHPASVVGRPRQQLVLK
jgi:hypothetical protein